ncbi:RNA polymerase sigma factor [Niastella sp. OAS944]|uniref:RNA polymerase sigma factor n=1 Tax=Niastella sp. OAS944 TaxID=2664089 RepID=UPI00349AB8BC|nr:RNA polymerase sigma-70 factor (ECF subfamily) [Chitinophagaceae bacterium OAS944]
MKQLTDETLIEFSQGSPQAFQAIFDSFRMRIFYFVKKLIDDVPTAEEITSDTFVKLHRLHDKFNTYNNIQAFLFITARNASLDYLKYRQRQREHFTDLHEEDVPEIPMFAETDVHADVLRHIYEEIERLPERSRNIFKLYYIEDLSLNEIADRLGISRQTVANQKHTALKTLKMKLLDRPGLLLLLLFLVGVKKY